MRLLIKSGANVDDRNGKGETPLYIAARASQSNVVEYLTIDNTADLDPADSTGSFFLCDFFDVFASKKIWDVRTKTLEKD